MSPFQMNTAKKKFKAEYIRVVNYVFEKIIKALAINIVDTNNAWCNILL